MNLDPLKDGVDHINVYSKGKTELGRFLSNFTRSQVQTEDGLFESIEGYWYWLLTDHPGKDALRFVFGYQTKQLGRELGSEDWPHSANLSTFRRKIGDAIVIKIKSNEKYLALLKESQPPFFHYYVYGDKVVRVKNCGWMMDTIDWCRRSL